MTAAARAGPVASARPPAIIRVRRDTIAVAPDPIDQANVGPTEPPRNCPPRPSYEFTDGHPPPTVSRRMCQERTATSWYEIVGGSEPKLGRIMPAGRYIHAQAFPNFHHLRRCPPRILVGGISAKLCAGAGDGTNSWIGRPCSQPGAGIRELSALGRRPGENAHRYGRRDLSALRPVRGQAERPRAGGHLSSAP